MLLPQPLLLLRPLLDPVMLPAKTIRHVQPAVRVRRDDVADGRAVRLVEVDARRPVALARLLDLRVAAGVETLLERRFADDGGDGVDRVGGFGEHGGGQDHRDEGFGVADFVLEAGPDLFDSKDGCGAGRVDGRGECDVDDDHCGCGAWVFRRVVS